MPVRVRFAPSPTGDLHVGGARTALFNYLFAKKHNGSFILRIEDTDQERHQEQALPSFLSILEWMGLAWDEGLFTDQDQFFNKGSKGPYRQKDRLPIYKDQAEKLLKLGKAYYCFVSKEEIEAQKEKFKKEGQMFQLKSPYRDLSLKEAEQKIQEGLPYCIRFKTPTEKKHYTLKDLVRGEITFPSDTAGDFILMRSGGFPVYNFSCAIDDALMEVTHVLRGEEHLSNTVKQIMIQEALGFSPPQTGHLSIILGKDKKKLSKRKGAQSVNYFKEEGFLPEALINFFALLGWNPGTEQEYYTKEDLIKSFSTKGLNAAAAVFDEDKLLWINSEHIKNLDNQSLWEKLIPFFKKENLTFKEDKNWQDSLLDNLKSGFKTLKQAVEILKPFSLQGISSERFCKTCF